VSISGLNQLLGEAVVSDHFRSGLLNGRRAELVADPRFKLDPDEAQALLSIEASNLQEFAVAVELYLSQRKSVPSTGRPDPVRRRLHDQPFTWISVRLHRSRTLSALRGHAPAGASARHDRFAPARPGPSH
jgi:hypothetical protein